MTAELQGGGKKYRVINATRGEDLASESNAATNLVTRGFGLMGRKGLPSGGGLIIRPCNSIVSFFMRFPFDAVFVDADGKVAHTIESMPAWRTSKIVRGSKFVVELPAGTVARTGTQIGDAISIKPV